MKQIENFEEFQAYKDIAIRERKYKVTNYLVSDKEMRLHIEHDRVRFLLTDDFLCFAVRIRKYNYLYFWCSDTKTLFMPDDIENPMLTTFGCEALENCWIETAEHLGLVCRSKLLQVSAAVKNMFFPALPKFLTKKFRYENVKNYTFDYYCELSKDYFDFENDILPERYIFDELLAGKLHLAEAKTIDGKLAGFCSYTITETTLEPYFTAVFQEFRGFGLFQLFAKEYVGNCKFYKTWCQDWNTESLHILNKLGVKTNGKYRLLFGKEE